MYYVLSVKIKRKKDYHDKCSKAYESAKSRNHYAKKSKISDLKDQPNQTDQTQQVQTNINSSFEFPRAGSSNDILDDPSLKPSKPLSK